VPVPAGDHHVTFTYSPPHRLLLLGAPLAGVLLVAWLAVDGRRPRRRGDQRPVRARARVPNGE
jgi:hypothetical protein